MVARIFIGAMALMWLGYGAWCFLYPDYLREVAGITALGSTGLVDLRATYGGLQMAIGAILVAGALREQMTRQVLVFYGVVCAGLGSSRLAAALLEADWSGYTVFAVCFELGTVAIVLWLLNGMRRG